MIVFFTMLLMFGICCLLGIGGNYSSESACGEDGLFCTWLIPLKTKNLPSVDK
jgi:hypothetical protein